MRPMMALNCWSKGRSSLKTAFRSENIVKTCLRSGHRHHHQKCHQKCLDARVVKQHSESFGDWRIRGSWSMVKLDRRLPVVIGQRSFSSLLKDGDNDEKGNSMKKEADGFEGKKMFVDSHEMDEMDEAMLEKMMQNMEFPDDDDDDDDDENDIHGEVEEIDINEFKDMFQVDEFGNVVDQGVITFEDDDDDDDGDSGNDNDDDDDDDDDDDGDSLDSKENTGESRSQFKPTGVKGDHLTEEALHLLKKISRISSRNPMELPNEHSERYRNLLRGRHLAQLTSYYDSLKERVKGRKAQNFETFPIRYSWKEALAYSAFDMTPRIGINKRILEDGLKRIDEETRSNYRTMLDFGSGPGTAVLAARELDNYLPNLGEAILVEPSRSMWECANEMIFGQIDYKNETTEDILARFKDGKNKFGLLWCPSLPKLVQGLWGHQFPKYDIVTATFSMSELASDVSRYVTLGLLWSMVAPGGVLVIAENSDAQSTKIIQDLRYGFLFEKDRIERALHRLIKAKPFDYDGKIVAPCYHQSDCPINIQTGGGCYYVQEAPRSITKASNQGQGLGRRSSPFGFTYLTFQKDKIPREEKETNKTESSYDDDDKSSSNLSSPSLFENEAKHGGKFGRIVTQPKLRQDHLFMDICSSQGKIERIAISKRKRNKASTAARKYYKIGRKAVWGGSWFTPKTEPKERPRRQPKGKGEHVQRMNETNEEN